MNSQRQIFVEVSFSELHSEGKWGLGKRIFTLDNATKPGEIKLVQPHDLVIHLVKDKKNSNSPRWFYGISEILTPCLKEEDIPSLPLPKSYIAHVQQNQEHASWVYAELNNLIHYPKDRYELKEFLDIYRSKLLAFFEQKMKYNLFVKYNDDRIHVRQKYCVLLNDELAKLIFEFLDWKGL